MIFQIGEQLEVKFWMKQSTVILNLYRSLFLRRSLYFFKFFYMFYLFLRERERERESMSRGGAERERETQNPKQAPSSELSAQSQTWGSNSWTMRSWPELKSDASPTRPPGHPRDFLCNVCWQPVNRNRASGCLDWPKLVGIGWAEVVLRH